MVIAGDMTGPFSANVVLSNPTVEVAVLETARGGILRGGLGFDECDVGVVLNVSSDHLGLRGIHTVDQMAEVKSVVPAVVSRSEMSIPGSWRCPPAKTAIPSRGAVHVRDRVWVPPAPERSYVELPQPVTSWNSGWTGREFVESASRWMSSSYWM